MIRALLLLLALGACTPPPPDLPADALLSNDVIVRVRVDLSADPEIAQVIATETATLLGPPALFPEIQGDEFVLVMRGRVVRGFGANGRPALAMDWDVRDPGGTEITLFRIAIHPRDGAGDTISRRDAKGLAFYSAEGLILQDAVREIIRARR